MRINKHDDYRVLLTELLPFETPMFFSNDGFYRFCRERLSKAPVTVKRILCCADSKGTPAPLRSLRTIPYTFEIRKGAFDTRTVSLMHPAVQLHFVDFYRRYAHTILHLCGRSRFSLRHPEAIGSSYHWPDELNDEETKYSTTYFKYEKYRFLHMFYNNYEFLRLEKRFSYLLTFDIANCFSSIYTHSISWAVRRKSFAKAHIPNRTFDSEFDHLMQAANDKETAGILVGPEVSRIFAEMILQRVDMNVLAQIQLDKQRPLYPERDFAVRRYVDDHFVFAKDRETAVRIRELYRDELRPYHLHINMQKVEETSVPFMSKISCAKEKLKVVVSEFFSSITGIPAGVPVAGKPTKVRGTSWHSSAGNHFIRQVKVEVKTYGVDYSSVCSYVLTIIEKQARQLLTTPRTGSQGSQAIVPTSFLLALLDSAFFVYAMDVRATTTDKIARLVRHVTKYAATLDGAAAEQVKKKMYDELLHALELEAQRGSDQYVEALNLLPPLRLMGDEYRIPVPLLEKLVSKLEGSKKDYEPVRYFLAVALLFHIGHDSQQRYSAQKKRIQEHILALVSGAQDPLFRADCTCLLLDMLSCPFVDTQFKEQLLDSVTLNDVPLNAIQKQEVMSTISTTTWFSNWHAQDKVDELLEKRRYRTPY